MPSQRKSALGKDTVAKKAYWEWEAAPGSLTVLWMVVRLRRTRFMSFLRNFSGKENAYETAILIWHAAVSSGTVP